jgi:hypothetical protein
MINFFRNTRKGMLNNSNFKKYLIYAFGEIILVVVGILIALSINNWNNKGADREAEIQIYQNLKNQINEDKEVINGIIDYNNVYLKEYNLAHQIIEKNERNKIDTLKKIAFNLFRYSDINIGSNIYQNMGSSGELKLLKNSTILDKIQGLEVSYIYMNRLEENHFQMILRFVGPGIMDNINLSTGKVDRPDELFKLAFHNHFLVFIVLMKEKDEVYQRALKEIDLITKLIDEELKR